MSTHGESVRPDRQRKEAEPCPDLQGAVGRAKPAIESPHRHARKDAAGEQATASGRSWTCPAFNRTERVQMYSRCGDWRDDTADALRGGGVGDGT
jgi:hypothetical protein